MLEDERPHGVGVTLGTNSKLASSGAHLMAGRRSMRIVTVAALYESHIDAMPIRTRELGLLSSVAAVAQFGL